jgi:hypothetical protein
LLADPKTGVLREEHVRAQYDGSLYYALEKRSATAPFLSSSRIQVEANIFLVAFFGRQKSGNKLPLRRGGELW